MDVGKLPNHVNIVLCVWLFSLTCVFSICFVSHRLEFWLKFLTTPVEEPMISVEYSAHLHQWQYSLLHNIPPKTVLPFGREPNPTCVGQPIWPHFDYPIKPMHMSQPLLPSPVSYSPPLASPILSPWNYITCQVRNGCTIFEHSHISRANLQNQKPRKSIPYWMLYRFSHRYDIFRIPINTGIPFWVYRYFIYLICIYTHTHTNTSTQTHRYTNTPSVEQNFVIYYLIILKLFIRKLLLHTQYYT